MLRPICNITITKSTGNTYVFDYVNEVEIKSSYERLTDTAKVVLPRKLTFQGKTLFSDVNAIFKRGDEIKIELGYFPNLRTVFEGYISVVGGSLPIELECEDKMYLLKKTTIKKIAKTTTTLKELLTDILPSGIKFDALDVQLGSFRISNATVSQILDDIKSGYGFYSYFVDGVLHVGLPSDASDTNTEEFPFETLIIDDEDLKYQIKEEIGIKVVAISMQSDNSKKEVTVGDADGSQRTFYTYNATESALKEFASLKLNKVKYTGYTGSFETFGEPYLRHGDVAKLTSEKLPERDGNYEVISVNRKFGVTIGYRQYIELGTILSGT